MQKLTTRLAGVDYKLGWSLQVYKDISEATGVDFNHIRSSVFNAINDINTGLGKTPKFYGDVEESERDDFHLYATRYEADEALSKYSTQFDLEFNERMTKLISMADAARIFYCAAKACNSLVEKGEIDQGIIDQDKIDNAVFEEGIKPGGGYLYLVVQFISWSYTQGQKDEVDEKKSGKRSFLQKFMQILST